MFRVGHGFDLHRLEPPPPEGEGRPFILGGVRIEHETGPVGHSDGDVVLHALTDALLGAIGAPDIGELFPDDDPDLAGADSGRFVAAAIARVRQEGYEVSNVDITVVCERPKVSPHKAEIITNVARLLGCDASRVNVKGRTHEGVDAVGEGRAIVAHAVVALAGRSR